MLRGKTQYKTKQHLIFRNFWITEKFIWDVFFEALIGILVMLINKELMSELLVLHLWPKVIEYVWFFF